MSWVPRPLRNCRRAGTCNACTGGLITPRDMISNLVQTASCPTPAKNARMGHPPEGKRKGGARLRPPSHRNEGGLGGEAVPKTFTVYPLLPLPFPPQH